jgi:hypothetical protein
MLPAMNTEIVHEPPPKKQAPQILGNASHWRCSQGVMLLIPQDTHNAATCAGQYHAHGHSAMLQ